MSSLLRPPPTFCSDPSQLIHRSPFYLLGKTGGCDCKSALIWWEGFCFHVFSVGMLHLLTHTQVWEGRSRYFWLRLQCCSKHHHPRLLSCFGSFQREGHVLLKLYPVVFVVAHTACPHDRTGTSNNKNEASNFWKYKIANDKIFFSWVKFVSGHSELKTITTQNYKNTYI